MSLWFSICIVTEYTDMYLSSAVFYNHIIAFRIAMNIVYTIFGGVCANYVT